MCTLCPRGSPWRSACILMGQCSLTLEMKVPTRDFFLWLQSERCTFCLSIFTKFEKTLAVPSTTCPRLPLMRMSSVPHYRFMLNSWTVWSPPCRCLGHVPMLHVSVNTPIHSKHCGCWEYGYKLRQGRLTQEINQQQTNKDDHFKEKH